MGIDTSIYALGRQQPDLADSFQSGLQAGNQNRITNLLLQDRQRSVDRENGKNKLLKELPPGTTSEQLSTAFRNNGYLNEADQVDTAIQNRTKTASEAQAKKAEAFGKFMTTGHELLGRVVATPDIATATAALDAFQQYGKALGFDVDADVAAQRQLLANLQTPDQIKQWAAGHAIATKELLPKTETRNTGGATETLAIDPVTGQVKVVNTVKNTVSPDAVLQANTSRANTAATVAATVRGQDLNDARAREQLAQGKVPSGYRQNPDGTLVAIPGGPADQGNKAPTEFQGKSAAFGARAEQADKILTGLQGQYRPAMINSKNTVENTWLVGGALGAATNKLGMSEADQKAEQAQRDFVNAVLRQESGAAISTGEFENARKQYFPQPGDSAAVIQQKAANRKLAVQGLRNNAGHAAFSAPADTPGVPADIAALIKKHGGK